MPATRTTDKHLHCDFLGLGFVANIFSKEVKCYDVAGGENRHHAELRDP